MLVKIIFSFIIIFKNMLKYEMQKIPRFPRLRSRRQRLQYLIFLLIGGYCFTLLCRIRCTESYRNIRNRVSRNVFYNPEDTSCFHKSYHVDELNFIKKYAIYIISASCDSSLSRHHVCAIESALSGHAYDKKVYVFVSNPVKDCLCNKEIIEELSDEPNLEFITIQIDQFVEKTPLEGVFEGDFFKYGSRQEARVIEYLKFAALYKFGGVVIDLDMIVAKPLWYLSLNWGAKMNGSQLGSAAVALDKRTPIGMSLLKKTMELLREQTHQEEVDGGLALTEAFKQLCSIDPITGCSNFVIHDTKHFYPYNRSNNYLMFRDGDKNPYSYGYYVWERPVITSVSRGSVYGQLMYDCCPRIWDLLG